VERAAGEQPGYRFVMSDGAPDRAHDIVEQTWDLAAFESNPVAPFNHCSWERPVGRWADVGVVGGRLEGIYEPYAPTGEAAMAHPVAVSVSEMVGLGFLRAVYVGFLPRRAFSRSSLDPADPRYGARGYVFAENELLECSIVTVPMNPNATMIEAVRPAGPPTVRDGGDDGCDDEMEPDVGGCKPRKPARSMLDAIGEMRSALPRQPARMAGAFWLPRS
jgi:hypothetical protein